MAIVAGSAIRAATPPAGFEDHVIVDPTSATGASTPTGIAYEPGSGALFVLEKGSGDAFGTARVRRRNPSTGVVTTALTLSCVNSQDEGGLVGIAFDPDYLAAGSARRYVYLFYTRNVASTGNACAIAGMSSGPYTTVSRFKESGGTLMNEQVLLRGPKMPFASHLGGSLRFAADKTLYISMGDNEQGLSRDLSDLRGKILRIHSDGTIPLDNPFVAQTGARHEIWARGFRNPYRMSFDSQSGKLYIADVGETTWEEIDVGAAGGDYGWPCLEASATYDACNPPPSGDIKPIYAYGHDGQTSVVGHCVIGGPVYRGSAFPSAYRGRYFFGDWSDAWIRSAAIAPNGTLTDVQMFMNNVDGLVDMAVSPSGCLTWVGIGGQGVHDTCYGSSVITVSADWDGSGRIDGIDLAALGRAFGSSAGGPRYDASLDLTDDGIIDGDDLAVLASEFGQTVSR